MIRTCKACQIRSGTGLPRRGAAVLLCTLAAAVASLATVAILRASVHQHRRSDSLRSVATAKWSAKGLEARADAVLLAINAGGLVDPASIATAFMASFQRDYRSVRAQVVTDARGQAVLQVYLQRSSRVPDLIRPLP